jgi:hypothetical protein
MCGAVMVNPEQILRDIRTASELAREVTEDCRLRLARPDVPNVTPVTDATMAYLSGKTKPRAATRSDI